MEQGMYQTHRIVRDAHAQRLARRKESASAGVAFDSVAAARLAGKVALRGDRADLFDVEDLDAFEDHMVTVMLGVLEGHPVMPVTASKVAFEIIRGKDYQPKLYRQMMVGSQALAVEAVMGRLLAATEQVLHHLSVIPHEEMPAIVDQSQVAESDAFRARVAEERAAGARPPRTKAWLFGKGAGIPPAERKRQAEEAYAARRAASVATSAGADGVPEADVGEAVGSEA